MKKSKLTLREAAGLTIGFAGAMMTSVVDGSPCETGIRLAGVALVMAGAWVGKAFRSENRKLRNQSTHVQ